MAAADLISQLPVAQNAKTTAAEDALVSHLFGSMDTKTKGLVSSHFKGPLLVGAITGILLLPAVDDLVRKYVPSSRDNVYYMIMVKVVLAIIAYYVMSNWSLARG